MIHYLAYNAVRLLKGALFVAILLQGSLFARDINLDALYLLNNSAALARLTSAKLDIYSAVGATLVDSDVAFAGWSSGDSLIFIKDRDSRYDIYEYTPSTRSNRLIISLKGTVIHAAVMRDGQHLLTKIVKLKSTVQENKFVVVSLKNPASQEFSSKDLFIDFSISPYGSAYIRETPAGIVEFSADLLRQKQILAKNYYSAFIRSDQSVIPFTSINIDRIAIINGAGGSYRGFIFDKGRKIADLDSISSAAEFLWIGSDKIAYRTGYPGNYRLAVYSISNKSIRTIGSPTLNTNISYCPSNGLITFLQDGCLSFWNVSRNEIELYPLEGEDALFAPDGNRFCALYGGRLFIMQRSAMKNRTLEMTRIAAKISEIYRTAMNSKNSFANDFTGEYLIRKESLYKKLSK